MDQITPLAVRERLSFRLRKLIGPGGRMTLAEAAKATDISEATLKAYAAGTACPNLAKFKRLLLVLGPELGRDIDRMYGWMPRSESSQPGAIDLAAFRSELVERLRLLDRMLAEPRPAPETDRTG